MRGRQAKLAPAVGKSASVPSKEDTRERLLDAAERVFVESGYYDATVREICKRAGVNLALVNYHFGDKLQLYTEVIRRAMNLSKVEFLEGVSDFTLDPRALLHKLVTGFLRHMKHKDSAFDILLRQETLRPTPAMDIITKKRMRPTYQAICTLAGRILKLPAEHETTRLVTHGVIAQIKYFGEPQRILTRLDPTILAGKTDEELADFIISFSFGQGPEGITSEVANSQATTHSHKANQAAQVRSLTS
jgi:AcrR family transcriptional regulator